jgi:hypothetical protein
MKRILFILLLASFAKAQESQTDHLSKILDTVLLRSMNQENSLLKENCLNDIRVLTTEGASATIEDYNRRFKWLLFTNYYFDTTPDTTDPVRGLNVDYQPSSDQARIFPANLGLWYDYPVTSLQDFMNSWISSFKATATSNYQELRKVEATRYSNVQGMDYTCKYFYKTTTMVVNAHFVLSNGIGYFIFYITTETDYNGNLSRVYYDLLMLPIIIATTSTSADHVEMTVYITSTGSKYHNSGCYYLNQSSQPIDLTEACSQGYTPCSVCSPPSCTTQASGISDAAIPGFRVSNNYPNPFNASTVIEFEVDIPQTVSAGLYDIRGALVKNVYRDHVPAGSHSIRIDAVGIPSGTYFYIMSGESGREIKKIAIIK